MLVGSVGALLLVGLNPSQSGAYGYAVMLGIGYAVTAAIMPAMVADRFQGRHFGSILGVGLFGSSAGSAFGPWMSGFLHDKTGSYTLPFVLAALAGMLALAAGWLARTMRRNEQAASGA